MTNQKNLTKEEWLKLQRYLDRREESRWEKEAKEAFNGFQFKNELEKAFWNDRE